MRSRLTALRRRARSLNPEHVDWIVAAVLFAGFQVAIWTGAGHQHRGVAAVAAIVPVMAVALRRKWLIEVLAVGLVTIFVKLAVWGTNVGGEGGGIGVIAVLLLFYGAGAFYSGRRSLAALALGVVVLATAELSATGSLATNLELAAVVSAPAWLLGRTAREHASRERAGRERAERLDAERELHVHAAAVGERARLAREIHDVIAHSVSVMVIQAAGARTVMDREVDRAEESLRAVERAGREALAELRRLLGILGDGHSLRALAPQPGLEDLQELISNAGAAGVPVSMCVEGRPVAVSPGLSLCAYRVVQEALTNAIKHAGGAEASVAVRWSPDSLELVVSDDGRGDETTAGFGKYGGGHGIAGMRERVALHGGTVEAGRGPDGGFAVRALIPLAVESAA